MKYFNKIVLGVCFLTFIGLSNSSMAQVKNANPKRGKGKTAALQTNSPKQNPNTAVQQMSTTSSSPKKQSVKTNTTTTTTSPKPTGDIGDVGAGDVELIERGAIGRQGMSSEQADPKLNPSTDVKSSEAPASESGKGKGSSKSKGTSPK